MEPRPIAAFYCCYLLRSTVRHASIYVGSTPNPARRLAQHNGLSKGGAVRTSRTSLRPWEMACIVTGFPSQVAALQFEWAWQNTHLTRHIPSADRINNLVYTSSTSRSGRTRQRPSKPRSSLNDKIANLQLLLQASAFSRWPLELHIFFDDVYQIWRQCIEKGKGQLSNRVRLILEPEPYLNKSLKSLSQDSQQHASKLPGSAQQLAVSQIDASYRPIKQHVEKSIRLLEPNQDVRCKLCKASIAHGMRKMILVCPNAKCLGTFHMSCLSTKMLESSKENGVIPVAGNCPSCNSSLRWLDLMREMSVRSRGDAEVTKLLKSRRGKNSQATSDSDLQELDLDSDEDDTLHAYKSSISETDAMSESDIFEVSDHDRQNLFLVESNRNTKSTPFT